MQIDRPAADVASSGINGCRLMKTAQQRSQQKQGRTEPAGDIRPKLRAGNATGIHFHPIPLLPDAAAQLFQKSQHMPDVCQFRAIRQFHRLREKTRSRQNRQRSVFGSVYGYLPPQGDPPHNLQLRHVLLLSLAYPILCGYQEKK